MVIVITVIYGNNENNNENNIEWFRTQLNTGHIGNCGPAVVAMSTLWYENENDIISVSMARDLIGEPYNLGATSFDNLDFALNKLEIPHYFEIMNEKIEIYNEEYRINYIENIIDKNRLVIMLLWSNLKNEYFGHYIIFYDYGENFFNIADPLFLTPSTINKYEAVQKLKSDIVLIIYK